MSKTLADAFKEAGVDAGRGGGYTLVDPEGLVVVRDKEHFLYDPRVEEPLDEAFVLELMQVGVHTPIRTFSNGVKNGRPNVLVVAGRRRTLHLREANKRRAARGEPPFRIPTIVVDGDDKSLVLLAISENAHRKQESPASRAAKVQRALQLGCTETEVSRALGVSFTTLKQLREYVNLDPSVQTAIDKKEIPLSATKSFAAVPREDQAKALDVVKKSGARKTFEVKPAVEAATKGTTVELPERQRVRSRREIESIVAKLESEFGTKDDSATLVIAVLNAVTGDVNRLRRTNRRFARFFE